MGRPTKYNAKIAAKICEALMAGKSLRNICGTDGIPACSNVFSWLQTKPEFQEQYARAREVQAEVLADEIIVIADDGQNDTYQDSEGRDVVNYDHIQRSKLRVDARKWVAAKLLPKKFGDRVNQVHTGENGGPIAVENVDARLNQLLAIAAERAKG